MENEFGILILAAGQSSRLGRPKQSLFYKDGTLLHRLVKAAHKVDCGPVVVVLGSNAPLFASDCQGATTVLNTLWKNGMAGSICCGIETLRTNFPAIQGTIIAVCDQPFVSAAVFQQLLDKHRQSRLPIIASHYGSDYGTPAFFHNQVFPELLQLQGDRGAKSVMQQNTDRLGFISFPPGATDIDTEEDYNRLVNPG